VHADSDPSNPASRDPPSDAGFHARRWRRHKGFALLVGALTGSLAGYANSTLGLAVGLPFALVSENAFLIVLSVVVAPLVEEHVKLVPLWLLETEEKATYTPRRWMTLGTLSGLGFGIAEALFYLQALAGTSLQLAGLNLLTRLLLTVPLHGVLVAITGYGYGLARARGRARPIALALAAAILLHAAFNAVQVGRAIGVVG
jgi:RsiW-degrading membrane proteinase PrsW (M82 family)